MVGPPHEERRELSTVPQQAVYIDKLSGRQAGLSDEYISSMKGDEGARERAR